MQGPKIKMEGLNREYDFTPILSAHIPESPGIYIFAKQTPTGWMPLYIGETENIKTRISGHEKIPCVERHGGKDFCVLVYVNVYWDRDRRLMAENDLVSRWNPPCNE